MEKWKTIFFIIAVMASCKKPYLPAAVSVPNNYLVVEGVINSGSDLTTFKLSRTVNLSSKVTTNRVSGAALTVESDQNSSYALTETTNGQYIASGLNLDNSRKYRLRIKTADNLEYLSDFVEVKANPQIDSVGFIVQGNGIQLYANTHDANNNTRYYRYDYNETWQFHAKYQSLYITNGTAIVLRTPAQATYDYFGNDTSSTIVLGSSAKLTQDVLYQNPLTQIDATSEKLERKYSILVKQYALTRDAYNFYINLKKNTEQLGSIFDAQPSNINGNIHSVTNPSEPVIGYISVTNVQQKRIFIENRQLPHEWLPTHPFDCTEDSNLYHRIIPNTNGGFRNEVEDFLIHNGDTAIPTNPIFTNGITIIGFLGTFKECADCTIRGVIKQPDFWK